MDICKQSNINYFDLHEENKFQHCSEVYQLISKPLRPIMSLVNLIESNEALLLFLVISIGVLVGSLKFRGKSIGVSMVLFVGLLFGNLNPNLEISQIILVLGLSIFIYSIGLNSGRIFFDSYKKNGFRDIVFSFAVIAMVAILAIGLWYTLGFSAAAISGIYAGASTNTPAFAAVIDYIQNNGNSLTSTSDLVVAYTLAYPIGIIGSIIGIIIMGKILKVDYQKEYKQLRTEFPLDNNLTSAAVEVTQVAATDIPIRDLLNTHKWHLRFGRILKGENLSLSSWDTSLNLGDKVMVLGAREDIDEAIALIGKQLDNKLSYDRSTFDSRRIFMSNPKLAGRTIASLNLSKDYDAVITRIRRGDNDMLANGDTILELGDRIRFIAKRDQLSKLSLYFGDSYQASSRINLFSFGFGIVLGLLLGSIDIPLTADIHIKLGFAGGPLVVGLLFGYLKRTGPILWTLPYSSSIVLQQLGLMFLLAYIGVNNGSVFFDSLNSESMKLVGAATFLSIASAILVLSVGYKIVKIPFSLLMGMVSNQPAVIEFANQKSGSKIPQMGFALILPIALIMKLIITQLLYIVLR